MGSLKEESVQLPEAKTMDMEQPKGQVLNSVTEPQALSDIGHVWLIFAPRS